MRSALPKMRKTTTPAWNLVQARPMLSMLSHCHVGVASGKSWSKVICILCWPSHIPQCRPKVRGATRKESKPRAKTAEPCSKPVGAARLREWQTKNK
jgi:hypothetical protein